MKLLLWIISIHLIQHAFCENEFPATEDKTNEAQLVSKIAVGDSTVEQRNYQIGAPLYNSADLQSEPYTLGSSYHNYDQMTKFLRTTTSKYPSLTALYSIGKSVQGEY